MYLFITHEVSVFPVQLCGIENFGSSVINIDSGKTARNWIFPDELISCADLKKVDTCGGNLLRHFRYWCSDTYKTYRVPTEIVQFVSLLRNAEERFDGYDVFCNDSVGQLLLALFQVFRSPSWPSITVGKVQSLVVYHVHLTVTPEIREKFKKILFKREKYNPAEIDFLPTHYVVCYEAGTNKWFISNTLALLKSIQMSAITEIAMLLLMSRKIRRRNTRIEEDPSNTIENDIKATLKDVNLDTPVKQQ